MLAVMQELGVLARAAGRTLALSPTLQRNTALLAMAKHIRTNSKDHFRSK